MKKILFKISSLLLSFLVLAATVSWTVKKHYCFGNLVDIAFFQEAESCGTIADLETGMLDFTVEEPPCCSSEVLSIKGLEDLVYSSIKDLKWELPFIFMVPTAVPSHHPALLFDPSIPNNYRAPSLQLGELQVRYQVFLL
ncbi:HYC_CC_PP family protein [Arenibacter lacus]|uniref:HYC_CC_PP family protein n=1 Tax=Arenibacter lacus TaxID=2608629 RepID=UPI00123CA485|nr:hypothetical protein [Arenibacter lacus]